MARNIDLTFSQSSIENAIAEIERYQKQLQKKNEEFVSKLADVGIEVGERTVTGEYKQYITFKKTIRPSKKGLNVTGKVAGRSKTITVRWSYPNASGYEKREVSPILMEEFGSGVHAVDASGKENGSVAKKLGYGRSTFPRQKHAFEPVWHWQDMDGEWHSSSGYDPSSPMWKAAVQMRMEIVKIAKEVFGR